MTDHDSTAPQLGAPIGSGPWEGWSAWTGTEPFEEFAGPFYARQRTEGGHEAGFDIQPHHLNGGGAVHGGALMTFADYSLFIIATDALAGLTAVTVSLSGDFVGAGPPTGRLVARGDVVKAGRSLVFVRGVIEAPGSVVLSFNGVVKIIRPPRV